MEQPIVTYLNYTKFSFGIIKFRRALVKDANIVLSLLRRAYQKPKSLGVVFPASSITLQKVKQNITRRKVYLLIANSEVVGTVSIRKRQFGYEICHLAVEPVYQDLGHGNHLLQFAEKQIKSTGNVFAYLFTAENHPWLPTFYRKRGYELLRVNEQNHMPLALYRKYLK